MKVVLPKVFLMANAKDIREKALQRPRIARAEAIDQPCIYDGDQAGRGSGWPSRSLAS